MSLFHRNTEGQPRKKHGCLVAIIICVVVYTAAIVGFGKMMDGQSTTTLKEHSVYKLKMEGVVVEQGPEDNPFASMMSEMYSMPGMQAEEKVGLDDLIRNIRLAKENANIEGIYLYGANFIIGQASAKALRDALLDFKESGKWIIAYADTYSQTNYYICSVADRLYLNPIGMVDWNGLSAAKMYFTRALEKLGVEMQILKVGTFKSAVEPFFCTSMSDADRHQTEVYLDGMWDTMLSAVSESRHIDPALLNRYADECMGLQPQDKLIEYHLIDSLTYAQGIDDVLNNLMGTNGWHSVSTNQMTHVKRAKNEADKQIAVVYADGEITDEFGDGIVSSKMLKTLKEVSKDNDVKAVVLRVNSPGGSAYASEQIWHAVKMLQEKGLPVVVSMGDYAASGGYYISCGADYIFAEPNTLTGSIGVFGTIPNISKLRDNLGIDIDGVSTNAHADINVNMIYKGMNESERQLMQANVERTYNLFTSRCAEGRHMMQDSIKAIGEGRVWLGKDALELGLVDQLGNIDNAIIKAADLAGIIEYKVTYFPEKKDFLTELMTLMNNTTEEEKLLLRLKTLVEKPRILALMPEVTIR
ncbi:MAG: signal peptide peptidase SppA [Paludibacteraceae bacterium]|nr:signal peptide peptidase SppA [Paludibacteraceae bacterium]